MKADLTRSTDRPEQHYRSVRMQQGRVQLDADWNEQQDILNRRIEQETVDTVGPAGAPIANAGFKLTGNGKNVEIGIGHLYLRGLLCDNPAPASLIAQPHLENNVSPILPDGASLLPLPPGNAPALQEIKVYDGATAKTPADGIYLGYLEAWLRHVSVLEDPLIREVALGGPDSATRDQLVWQVKLMRVGDAGASLDCLSDIPAWNSLTAAPDGRLGARAEPGKQPKDPCLLAPEAGYRRLENQLYRVEVHGDGNVGDLSFKWSRDNGSIVTRVVRWLNEPTADVFEVASIGRDAYLSISAECWLEFFDDTHELLGRPGTLVRVLKTEGNLVTLDLGSASGPLDKALFSDNPRVRRWDGWGKLKPQAAGSPYEDGWVELEDGVEVRFTSGKYRVGDYWTIPARTATADIEWPADVDGKKARFLPPEGVLRAFSRLALLGCSGGDWSVLSDCRQLFPALTEMTNLHYVGGDGQEVMPNPLAPQHVKLDRPLEVAVFNGQWPVAGAQVRFTASDGGTLNNAASQVVVSTLADGIARVDWHLAPATLSQTCSAELLVAGQAVADRFNEIHFGARLSVAAEVAYDPAKCPDMKAQGIRDVQAAIDALCQKNHGGGCCVCVGKGGEFAHLDQAIGELIKGGHKDICLCLLPGDHSLADSIDQGGEGINLLVHGAGPGSRLHLKDQEFNLFDFDSLTFRDFDIISPEGTYPIRFQGCRQLRLEGMRVAGLTAPGNSLLQVADARLFHLVGSQLDAWRENSGAAGLALVDSLAFVARPNAALALPGFALAVEDADAQTLIADSHINGRVSLYGESTSEGELDPDLLKRLGAAMHQGRIHLQPGDGALRLRNNNLRDLRFGDALVQRMKQLSGSTGSGELAVCYRSLVADANSFVGPESQLLAYDLAMSQNQFEPYGDVGLAVASQGKYLGNFAHNDFRLFVMGHAPEKFGNGGLNLVTI